MKRSTLFLICFAALLIPIGVMLFAGYQLRAAAIQDEVVQAANPLGLRGAVMEPPVRLVDFTLPSTRGENFTLSDYHGKVILLFFGYTSCPDVCPVTLADLTRVYRELGNLTAQVEVVFVSSDPERDTLQHLETYLSGFNPNFIGLRGEGQQLQTVADQFYAVAAGYTHNHDENFYEVMHTTSVMLIDPDGQWIARFPTGTPYQDIVHDVRKALG